MISWIVYTDNRDYINPVHRNLFFIVVFYNVTNECANKFLLMAYYKVLVNLFIISRKKAESEVCVHLLSFTL